MVSAPAAAGRPEEADRSARSGLALVLVVPLRAAVGRRPRRCLAHIHEAVVQAHDPEAPVFVGGCVVGDVRVASEAPQEFS